MATFWLYSGGARFHGSLGSGELGPWFGFIAVVVWEEKYKAHPFMYTKESVDELQLQKGEADNNKRSIGLAGSVMEGTSED